MWVDAEIALLDLDLRPSFVAVDNVLVCRFGLWVVRCDVWVVHVVERIIRCVPTVVALRADAMYVFSLVVHGVLVRAVMTILLFPIHTAHYGCCTPSGFC